MRELACLVVSAFFAYLIAQFQKSSSSSKSTKDWSEAQILFFDGDLRNILNRIMRLALSPTTLRAMQNRETLSQPLGFQSVMLANKLLEIEPSRRKAEDFVLQHGDNRLSVLSISFMWFLIHMFYGLFLDRLFAIRDLCLL